MGRLCRKCRMQATFTFEGSKPAVYCKKHAEDGMVDIRSRCCSHESCTTQARFGFEGNKAKVYCKKHTEEGMIDVCSQRCLHGSCTKRPNFNFEGKKKAYCKQHAEDGMVNVLSLRCLHDSCTKRPSFNFEGKKEAYCKLHAKDGMISVIFARRSSNGGVAARRAPTGRVPTECPRLKTEILDDPVTRVSTQQSEVGKVHIRQSRRCSHESCTTHANYRFEGNNTSKYCKKHAEDGMVNFNAKRCLHDSCTKGPSFSFEGEKAAYCKQHAQDGMVNVRSQRCLHASCTKRPRFNFVGRKEAYCKRHAEDGMVSIICARRSLNGSCRIVGTARREPTDHVPSVCVRLKREMLDDPVTSVIDEAVSGATGRLKRSRWGINAK